MLEIGVWHLYAHAKMKVLTRYLTASNANLEDLRLLVRERTFLQNPRYRPLFSNGSRSNKITTQLWSAHLLSTNK